MVDIMLKASFTWFTVFRIWWMRLILSLNLGKKITTSTNKRLCLKRADGPNYHLTNHSSASPWRTIQARLTAKSWCGTVRSGPSSLVAPTRPHLKGGILRSLLFDILKLPRCSLWIIETSVHDYQYFKGGCALLFHLNLWRNHQRLHTFFLPFTIIFLVAMPFLLILLTRAYMLATTRDLALYLLMF